MEGHDFDTLTCDFTRALSRRAFGGLTLGLALPSFLALRSDAKSSRHGPHKGKKTKKKRLAQNSPLVLNQFGCVSVGGQCKGDSANCCSGVCQREKPKLGQNDTSVCVAHNQGGCTPERNGCAIGPDASMCNPANSSAFCVLTTGDAGFCGDFSNPSNANCQPCARDTDCQAFGFPPGSACVLFVGGTCMGCEATGNRICLPPAI